MTASGSRIAEALLDPAAYLSVCECGKVNPKFGEDQPGGHFVDCFWDHERDVRTDCASILAAREGEALRLLRALVAKYDAWMKSTWIETGDTGQALDDAWGDARAILAALEEQPAAIVGYANPDGSGEGNWYAPTKAADQPYFDPLWDRYLDGDR